MQTLFSKERRENRPSTTHHFVKRAFPSVQDRHHFCYPEGREEDSQSCPCPALSQLRTVAASISATGLLVQTPHHFYMGLCLPLEAALRVLQQAGWEPLHSCLEGLRLKRGPMLTVPLRPWEELSIPTALSIK